MTEYCKIMYKLAITSLCSYQATTIVLFRILQKNPIEIRKVFQHKSKNFRILIKKCQKRVFKHRDRNVSSAFIAFSRMYFLLKFLNFWLFFLDFFGNSFEYQKKNLLLGGKLRLKGCLAMCLIFQENPGSRAYKLVAYKKNVYCYFYKSYPLNCLL